MSDFLSFQQHGQHDDEDGVNHARPDGRSMGQVIDLMGTSSDASSGADATGAGKAMCVHKGKTDRLTCPLKTYIKDETPEVCARRSVQKLEEGLKDMDAKSLVAAFRKAQVYMNVLMISIDKRTERRSTGQSSSL